MEHKSIELVDKNMASEAIDILESEQYQILKNSYSKNIDNIMNKYKGNEKLGYYERIQIADSLLQNTESLLQNSITVLVISTPVFIIAIIIFTVFVSRQRKNV